MNDKQYMQLAISEANLSKEDIPCGVVIVKGNEIVARAYNSHHADNDATAHAEIKAIKQTGQKLGGKNLIGCTVYCTCEPCTMCASALIYAQVDKIVYGVTMADVDPDNTRIMLTIEQLAQQIAHPPQITGGVLKQECHMLYH